MLPEGLHGVVMVNDYQTQGRDPTRARESLLMIHSFPKNPANMMA